MHITYSQFDFALFFLGKIEIRVRGLQQHSLDSAVAVHESLVFLEKMSLHPPYSYATFLDFRQGELN